MTKTLTQSYDSLFRRAAMPLILSGSTLLAGCSTVSKTQLDLDSCNYKQTFSLIVGAPDTHFEKKDEQGTSVSSTINGFNFTIGREKSFSAGEACKTSEGIVRAGVSREPSGDYNSTRLALLYAVYRRQDIDPTLKYMIAERTKQNFGFTPDEIPAIAKAQWDKNNPPAQEAFICTGTQSSRQCRLKALDSAQDSPQPH